MWNPGGTVANGNGRQSTSLRTLSLWASFLLAVVVAVSGVGLFLMAANIQGWAEVINTRSEGVFAADALEQRLLDYNRVRNLASAGVRGAEAEQQVALERLEVAMERARERTASATEAVVVERVMVGIDRWQTQRDALEAQGLGVDELIDEQRVNLDAALAAIRSLRVLNARDLEVAQQAVELQANRQRVVAAATAGLQGAGLLVLVVGLIVLVVRPMRDLEATVLRFSGGDRTARAQERGPAELVSISQAFNGLADALVRQRQAQLAHLGGVVHDMRDPLLAISLAVRRLRRVSAPGSEAGDTVDTLSRHVGRMERMIQDILDAARIESGVLDLQLETLDLRSILSRVVEGYRERAPTHEIEVELPASPVELMGDAGRLEQVMNNLLANAVKYSPAGSRVQVEVREEPSWWAISVQDQGGGIADEEIERIFTPFQRSAGWARTLPGVGLGLSVVRRIVDAHGGTLHVQSAVGVGSTFTIRLPRLQGPEGSPGVVRRDPAPA